MSLKIVLLLVSLAASAGIAFGYFLRWVISLGKKGSMELDIKQMMLEARDEAQKITDEAEKKAEEVLREARVEIKEKEEKNKKTEERLIKKEDFLDKRQLDIDKEVENIKQKLAEIKIIKDKTEALVEEKAKELENIGKLSKEEARKEIMEIVERESEEDLLSRMHKLEVLSNEKIEEKAKDILATTIQRLASAVPSEIMTTTVTIPSDEVKGKIIGKEGRNIKAFERETGVEVIVDDTPGSITLSSFDPVRRQVARVALENLIADGRIQPAKIEEAVEKSKQNISAIIKEKGEQAVYECSVYNLDPRIVAILGRLHFRTSYGQNVLQHSVEMSHIARMIAEELGANITVAKTAALLHDIGKAMDHEVIGTHVEIGRRILQKFGVSEEIVKGMQAHHGEYPFETIESIIVQIADAVSGGRPGARRDTVENYLKRLKELEAIANEFPGVEKSFALQAGREIRVFVTPTAISDIEAKKMAREIAIKIESELKYPGEIKVTIIRETRITEFAR
ncbi:MAG: ribonuclease Y [Candidatus Zambryskibacteria bacterium CG11_big_fil_rev_8_21_14_0_20_40_24]|uniref:Ribonuclease Y n=1 Tax=Candidatus Zambryskibacteria bacterium CG11_big_fil_rev_8_21_14_0_20_40_24 TaxID=1975116 RepID=A0A2H0K750_9BACT|nr:MAG: ribonuclease Y [Candidatus Zambryskibacteria bacterium CG11_big_fil_rev_8_21_14_0_20_40_24]